MNEVTIFKNEKFGKIRTVIGVDGKPLFCGKDVAEALGYVNPRDAIAKHIDAPDVVKCDIGVITGKKADGTDAMQMVSTTFVNESGLYALIFGSTLPNAKEFKHWVFDEILPNIHNNKEKIMENNQIIVFNNNKFGSIRTLDMNYEPLFCASDVCEALGYANSRKAVNDHVDEKDVTKRYTLTNGGKQEMTFVNESGLYALIFGSKLETAKEFKHWVTSEVLPSIRKTGHYSTKASDKELAVREDEAQIEKAKLLERLASNYSGRYRQILDAHITKELTGEFLLPLPKSERATLSATEIGKQLGVSSMKIGQIANAHNLKTDEYGEWFVDKAKNCNKEIRTFRYFNTALDEFQRYI